jgi:hypothetical protein
MTPLPACCLLLLMLRCHFLLQAAFGNDPNMKGFGLQVDGRQMEVQARVLPNPRLTYGSPANYDPKGSASTQTPALPSCPSLHTCLPASQLLPLPACHALVTCLNACPPPPFSTSHAADLAPGTFATFASWLAASWAPGASPALPTRDLPRQTCAAHSPRAGPASSRRAACLGTCPLAPASACLLLPLLPLLRARSVDIPTLVPCCCSLARPTPSTPCPWAPTPARRSSSTCLTPVGSPPPPAPCPPASWRPATPRRQRSCAASRMLHARPSKSRRSSSWWCCQTQVGGRAGGHATLPTDLNRGLSTTIHTVQSIHHQSSAATSTNANSCPPPPAPHAPARCPHSATVLTAGQQLYREVKQASDSMLGVPSQCVVAKKAGIGFPARGRPQCEQPCCRCCRHGCCRRRCCRVPPLHTQIAGIFSNHPGLAAAACLLPLCPLLCRLRQRGHEGECSNAAVVVTGEGAC